MIPEKDWGTVRKGWPPFKVWRYYHRSKVEFKRVVPIVEKLVKDIVDVCAAFIKAVAEMADTFLKLFEAFTKKTLPLVAGHTTAYHDTPFHGRKPINPTLDPVKIQRRHPRRN